MKSLTTEIANEVINTANEAIRFIHQRPTTGMLVYCEDTFTNLLRITTVLAKHEDLAFGALLHDAIEERLELVLNGGDLTLIELEDLNTEL